MLKTINNKIDISQCEIAICCKVQQSSVKFIQRNVPIKDYYSSLKSIVKMILMCFGRIKAVHIRDVHRGAGDFLKIPSRWSRFWVRPVFDRDGYLWSEVVSVVVIIIKHVFPVKLSLEYLAMCLYSFFDVSFVCLSTVNYTDRFD
jgi:hypothetical protein